MDTRASVYVYVYIHILKYVIAVVHERCKREIHAVCLLSGNVAKSRSVSLHSHLTILPLEWLLFVYVRWLWSGLLTDFLFPHITRRGMPLARVIAEGRKRETSLRRRMYGRKRIPPQNPFSSQGPSVPWNCVNYYFSNIYYRVYKRKIGEHSLFLVY